MWQILSHMDFPYILLTLVTYGHTRDIYTSLSEWPFSKMGDIFQHIHTRTRV